MEKKITDSVFEKKLLAYSLAAGAVLASTQDINAQRSGTSLGLTLDNSSINLNFAGQDKFRILNAGSSCNTILALTGQAGFITASGYIKAINNNISINATGADGGIWNAGISANAIFDTYNHGTGTIYIGLKFNASGGIRYGWVRCDLNKSDLYVIDYAYETTGSYITTDGALPVELASFNAEVHGNTVGLRWNTATEVNNHGFEIERKLAENAGWEKIGFVEGHGNSNSPLNYNFADANAPKSKLSYRLKQIDNDGKYTYSSIVEVANNTVEKFELAQNYPNPFNPSTKIKFSLPEKSQVSLRVFNSLGQEVSTLVNGELEAGNHEAAFNASGMPSGIYVYKISAGNYSAVKKMLMIK